MSTEVQEIHAEIRQAVHSGSALAWVKRSVDILVASVLLLMFSPLVVLITLLLKLTDSGPVFFVWNIIGAGGRPIRSYKFRTMVQAAETMEAGLRQQGQKRDDVRLLQDPE